MTFMTKYLPMNLRRGDVAIEIPAIGNRAYTDKTRLRGLKENILSPRRRTLFV